MANFNDIWGNAQPGRIILKSQLNAYKGNGQIRYEIIL